MRCVMGHGGRPGMEKEWKTSKEMCGGGALLDPGIHILDLVRHLAGPITKADAQLSRTFWNVDVCDNAFVTLRTASQCIAQCHISITEWKSTFSIEVFGTEGSIHVRGRGGFYGVQRFKENRRWEWLQTDRAPEPEIEYSSEEISFREELRAFLEGIEAGSFPSELGTGEDGLAALQVIDGIYATTPILGLSKKAQTV
jgi:predicted dehydrogenase